ncbi:hypothetical protein HBN74_00095 [Pseudomonas sp. WS 5019]|nr:hypothetical protein [Pseudomonas sp. WS 5019]NMY13968.1 hypothetical protein [Pseudomonas sp. WS 5019]
MKNLWLVSILSDFFQWSLSLLNKLVGAAAFSTLLVVSFSIVSQIFLMASFLLPLKVIILIGSEGVPGYFPGVLLQYEKNHIVFALVVLSVVFYFLYWLCEHLINFFSGRGAAVLLSRSRKLIIFPNQRDLAKNFFQRYTGMLSAFVFCLIAFLGVALVFGQLALFLLGLVLCVFLGCTIFIEYSESSRDMIFQNRSMIFNAIAALLFLAGFCFIVVDFLLGGDVAGYAAIIALLLVRQMFVRAAQGVLDGISLSAQRDQINSLFFHAHSYSARNVVFDRPDFWALLGEKNTDMIASVLQDVLGKEIVLIGFKWREVGCFGVLGFEVKCHVDDRLETFVVKVFERSREGVLVHEQALLSVVTQGFPSFLFLGGAVFEGFKISVFSARPSRDIVLAEQNLCGLEVLAELWSLRPPTSLVDMHARSKPTLSTRLATIDFGLLRLATYSVKEGAAVDRCAAMMPKVLDFIESMPLSIFNPELNLSSMRRTDEKVIVSHWGAWSVEPIGVGWFFKDSSHRFLNEWLQFAQNRRPELSALTVSQVTLISLMSALDFYYHRQSFRSSIELLPDILSAAETFLVET